ncbi:acyltransferase [Pseudoalteromonas sp. H103]|uniref:acyltransferase n=1 Tax=Pseudoalteromonas sp. H103 TaxID=1761893 RepID=UPI0009EAC52D|nr:acyltransferase [Pseudoalteromonas sp. H103]
MTGKEVFKFLYPIMYLLIRLFKVLPLWLRYFLLDCFSLVPSKIGVGIRYVLVSSMCKSIGRNVYIGRFVIIKNITSLSIGDNVSIHDYCYLDAIGGININDDVSIAHSSSLISFEHFYGEDDTPIKYSGLVLGDINIERNVWIGCGVRILSNSYIKTKVIVAAGSVVRGELKSSSIYAGVPARKVKDIV